MMFLYMGGGVFCGGCAAAKHPLTLFFEIASINYTEYFQISVDLHRNNFVRELSSPFRDIITDNHYL